jgi:hypothetical protein
MSEGKHPEGLVGLGGIPFAEFLTPQLKPLPMPAFSNPVVEATEANYASEFYHRLTKWIRDYDAKLDQAQEVGVRLVSFGQSVVFHLENMGYWNPSLISFKGRTDKDEPVELIQHVSQISILLMALPRKDPTQPKNPIGFQAESEGEETNKEKEPF